jgi:SAM-dependent methyltransferase
MDFNRYTDTYRDHVAAALRLPGCDNDLFLAAKGEHLLKLLGTVMGETSKLKILDVGCGIGLMEGHLARAGAMIVGVDVAVDAVRIAIQAAPDASFASYDGRHLPFSEGAFDAAVAVCVLHHVEPDHWLAFFQEMARVVRPGGVVAVYEHNPWNPATRIVVSRCEFDRDATLLSARTVTRLLHEARLERPRRQFLFFFPWMGRVWRAIEDHLGWLPIGAQYVALAIRGEQE